MFQFFFPFFTLNVFTQKLRKQKLINVSVKVSFSELFLYVTLETGICVIKKLKKAKNAYLEDVWNDASVHKPIKIPVSVLI